jgi:hypothetical protein
MAQIIPFFVQNTSSDATSKLALVVMCVHLECDLSLYLSIYLSIYLRLYSPCGHWPPFQFLNPYTVARTPWTGDYPLAMALPTHRTTQTLNKCTQIYMPEVWFEPTIPLFEWAKTVHASERAITEMVSYVKTWPYSCRYRVLACKSDSGKLYMLQLMKSLIMTRTDFDNSSTEIVNSNPTLGKQVWICFSTAVFSCASRGLANCRSPVHGTLTNI